MVSVRLQSKSKKYESITVWWGEDKNATVSLIQEDKSLEPVEIIVPFIDLVYAMEAAIKVFSADNFTLTSTARSVEDAFIFLVVEEGPFDIEERTIKFSVYKDSRLDLLAEVCAPFYAVRALVEVWQQREIRN